MVREGTQILDAGAFLGLDAPAACGITWVASPTPARWPCRAARRRRARRTRHLDGTHDDALRAVGGGRKSQAAQLAQTQGVRGVGGDRGIVGIQASVDGAAVTGEQAVAPAEYVRLRVRDNGVGMTADVQAHFFEPFLTTKEVGEGTGLGLALVQGVARHAGGFVTIDTAPHQGTTVSLYLPPNDGPVAVAAAAPAAAPPPVRVPVATPARILLVEDEAAVRRMTARMLERAGYAVLAASTPSEARAIFETREAQISLLVTDIVMPGMHGPDLAERLVAQSPDLAVVFVSGYSDTMPGTGSDGERVAFVPRPRS